MEFSVQVENEQWDRVVNGKVVSVTKLVAVEVYGFTLIMRNNIYGVLVSSWPTWASFKESLNYFFYGDTNVDVPFLVLTQMSFF